MTSQTFRLGTSLQTLTNFITAMNERNTCSYWDMMNFLMIVHSVSNSGVFINAKCQSVFV